MVVRVKVRISVSKSLSTECVVLVNAGAETEIPILALPPEKASEINLWPLKKKEVVIVEEFTSETLGYLPSKKVKVELLDEENNVLSKSEAYVLIKPGLNEPTISDALIEDLGIVIVRAKQGLWRHINDPETKLRLSVKR